MRADRAPSARYVNLATDGRELVGAGGRTEVFDRILVHNARALAGDAGDVVVWVHEGGGLSAARRAGADETRAALGVELRERGSSGWVIADGSPKVHLAFPGVCGDFAGTSGPDELLDAVEAFRNALGMAYAFSGASTLHKLIRAENAKRLGPAPVEPELAHWAPMAWSVPARQWARDVDHTVGTFLRAFDRNGAFLASWRGLRVSAGGWSEHTGPWRIGDVAGAESSRPAGYWFTELAPRAPSLFDPFARHPASDGPVWLTTPLLQLAVDLGLVVWVHGAWVADDVAGYLDRPAIRIGDALEALRPNPIAREVLKTAHPAARGWFEKDYGTQTSPRPYWGRAIHDRHAANVWRSLAKCEQAPVGFSDVDQALFVVDGPEGVPEGLRLGTGPGAWKPKGTGQPLTDELAELLAAGRAHDAATALESVPV